MDGETATRELRARGCTAPIVGLTGDTHTEDIDSFLQAGVTEVGRRLRLLVHAVSAGAHAGVDQASAAQIAGGGHSQAHVPGQRIDWSCSDRIHPM